VQTWRQNGSFPSFCPDKGICPEEFCRASVANSSFETLVINRVYISPTFRWRTGVCLSLHILPLLPADGLELLIFEMIFDLIVVFKCWTPSDCMTTSHSLEDVLIGFCV
jgi:hypothetical protein